MRMARVDVEGSIMHLNPRSFDEFHGITLCFITLNEEQMVEKFIEHHKPYVQDVCAVDGGSSDNTFLILSRSGVRHKILNFNGHFGDQKNRAIEMAKTDWILLLDPDEILSDGAIKALPSLINQDEFDCYFIPRKNTIDGVTDLSHGDDHQARLFRSYCRYVRPVHEELVGFKKSLNMEFDSGIYIEHKKYIKRHNERNGNYGLFQIAHMQSISHPGAQTKESFNEKFSGLLESMSILKKKIGVN